MADDKEFQPEWMWGAAAHALARLLAHRRFGPGVDMGGADNPTPGEIRDANQFMRDLRDNGWRNPEEAKTALTETHADLEASQGRERIAQERIADLEAILTALVKLKDGPRDEPYREARDEAWATARTILAKGEDVK